MQAGGRRFDPVILHHPTIKLKRKLAQKAPGLGLIFSRLLAVSFFNNLEEVKIYIESPEGGSMGSDCIINKHATLYSYLYDRSFVGMHMRARG